MSDLIGLFQPEITDFGRSGGTKLRFTKPRLHPAGPTIPFGHVGPHWTIPARNHRFRSFRRHKAALYETPLAPCWAHHSLRSCRTSLDYSSPKSQISVVPAAQSCALRNPACTLLGPPFPSVMSDLIGLFQPEITDFGRSSGAKLRFTKPRLHPAGPTIPFGHVGPRWTIPARNHRFRSFQRRKAALYETPLAPCWTHHLRWSADLSSRLSARPRRRLRGPAAQRGVSVSRSSAAPAACRRAGRPRPIRGKRWCRG